MCKEKSVEINDKKEKLKVWKEMIKKRGKK